MKLGMRSMPLDGTEPLCCTFNFLPSVIPAWWLCRLLSWEQHWWHLVWGSDLLCTDTSSKNMQLSWRYLFSVNCKTTWISCPSTRHGGAWGERRYSSYSFWTLALDGGEWSASRHGRALPPGKGPPVPFVQEAGWAPEPVWTQGLDEKSSVSVGDWTPIVQPVVRNYTSWSTAAPKQHGGHMKSMCCFCFVWWCNYEA
jgi:hypothetical protein